MMFTVRRWLGDRERGASTVITSSRVRIVHGTKSRKRRLAVPRRPLRRSTLWRVGRDRRRGGVHRVEFLVHYRVESYR